MKLYTNENVIRNSLIVDEGAFNKILLQQLITSKEKNI